MPTVTNDQSQQSPFIVSNLSESDTTKRSVLSKNLHCFAPERRRGLIYENKTIYWYFVQLEETAKNKDTNIQKIV